MIHKDTVWHDLVVEDGIFLNGVELFSVQLECKVEITYAEADLSADNPDDYYGGLTVDNFKIVYGFHLDENDNEIHLSADEINKVADYNYSVIMQHLTDEVTYSTDDIGGY